MIHERKMQSMPLISSMLVICKSIHTYMYVHMNTYMYVDMNTYMYVDMNTYMYIDMNTYT